MAVNKKHIKPLESVFVEGASLKVKRKINFNDGGVVERLKNVKEAQQSALQRQSVSWERLGAIRVKL